MSEIKIAENGGNESRRCSHPSPSIPLPVKGRGKRGGHHSGVERASVGKIARLPKAIREMLNRRLEDGVPTSAIVPWLNELLPVQTVLAAYFGGVAISPKNISNWRLTGFKRWQERQEILAEVRELAEEAADINESNPDGLMRMTATLACTKLLRALRDDKAGVDVTKAAFAIAALNNVEMSHLRVDQEDRRLQQKDEMVSLAYDKHYRNCAAIADRIKGDEQIDMVREAEFDNRDKIELIGRRMFGNLWKKRRLPWEDENFNKDEEELEPGGPGGPIAPPGAPSVTTPDVPSNEDSMQADNSGWADWTDGTNEIEISQGSTESLPTNRELSDYDRALREGKTHEEALYAQFTPVPKPKDEGPKSKLPDSAVWEPVHYAPCPTELLSEPTLEPVKVTGWNFGVNR